MAVTSGAPKLELRSVAGFEFGFMDFGGLILVFVRLVDFISMRGFKVGLDGACGNLARHTFSRDTECETGGLLGWIHHHDRQRAVRITEGDGLDPLGAAIRVNPAGTRLDELAEVGEVVK